MGYLRCGFCSKRTEVITMQDKRKRWRFRANCEGCGVTYFMPTFKARLMRVHSIEIEAAR